VAPGAPFIPPTAARVIVNACAKAAVFRKKKLVFKEATFMHNDDIPPRI